MATVDELISNAQTYVATVTASADEAFDNMRSDIDNIGFTVTSFAGVPLPPDPPAPTSLTAPTLDVINLELPSEPEAAPAYQDISSIDVGVAPELDAQPPSVTLPVLPAQLAAFMETLPEVRTDFDFPLPPSELDSPLPVAPVIVDRDAPVRPTISVPTFDAVQPEDNTTAPTDLAAAYNAAYRDVAPTFVATMDGYLDNMLTKVNPQFHTQMAAIETQLSRYLAGGTGLDATVEAAIYERARDRNNAEYIRTRDTALETAANLGHTMPGGAALAAIRMARQGAADNNARASVEIAIKQAEMEQENLRFAVTTSQALRSAMLSAVLSYHGNLTQINGQALDYARTLVAQMVEAYNVEVRAYQVRLEGYRVEASVYDTRLRAALATVDLYRSEIAALEALTNVDRAKVDIYRARIDALQSVAGVYRARVDAVVQQSNLEKTKLEVFQSKVQAFGAQVQAKRAEYDGYQAAIQGQESLVRLYGAQVQAYGTETQAWRAKIEGQAEAVRAQATTNRAKADQYEATLRGYTAVVQSRGEVAKTRLENQRQEIMAFDSQVRAHIANISAVLEHYKTKAEVILKRYQLDTDIILKSADQNIQRSKAIADAGANAGKVYQGMASAALTGMNTLVAKTLAE